MTLAAEGFLVLSHRPHIVGSLGTRQVAGGDRLEGQAQECPPLLSGTGGHLCGSLLPILVGEEGVPSALVQLLPGEETEGKGSCLSVGVLWCSEGTQRKARQAGSK